MKIAEVEEKMINEGLTEELFLEFQNAIKRVPKYNRCQHCYTTAWGVADKDSQGGIRLIKYGLENFESDWIDRMRANWNLGSIYERCKDYESAREAYIESLASVPDDKKESYLPDLSMLILKAEMHLNNFQYTEYAEKLYNDVQKADDFSASFRGFAFYSSIMEIILAKKNCDVDTLKKSQDKAMSVLYGDRMSPMDILLKKHKYKNDAHATSEAIAFLDEQTKDL